jgi:glucose-1-phosphate thymidylyltransferase
VKLVVLAAGYATRLYPLTQDRPKHLLEIAGRPMLEHLLERLPLGELDTIFVVTNAKFAPRFREWAERYPAEIDVIDDGTTADETRLGAIGDLDLVISTRNLDDDVIVAAGDSLFSDRLDGFVRFGREKRAPVVAVYDVGSLDAIKRYSAIAVDEEGRITSCEEKPEHPETTLAGVALYFYPRAILPLVRTYLDEDNNPDQPGRFVEWLYRRTPVHTWPVPGRWIDIGTHEALRDAEQVLGTLGETPAGRPVISDGRAGKADAS